MKNHAPELQRRIRHFCQQQRLPDAFASSAAELLWPLAQWLAQQRRMHGACLVAGVNGAQGTGKSTLCRLLAEFLDLLGLRSALLSIDDLYLTRAERRALARRVHPLLATRGVPGTHDVALGLRLLQRLRALEPGESVEWPRFDKSIDDRGAETQHVIGPVDIVLFEGWCVGAPPEPAAALVQPVNELEAREDGDARWRTWVNDRLASDYRALFAQLDRLIFLRAPDFSQVHAWRAQQEADTARAGGDGTHLLDDAALARFIQHYQRLTLHALRSLPDLADVVVTLSADHTVTGLRYRDGAP